MKLIKLASSLIIIFLFTLVGFADDKWILETPQNSKVVLKFAAQHLALQKIDVFNSGRPTYTAQIKAGTNGSPALNGEDNWRDKGWVWLQELVLQKVSIKNKTAIVELQTETLNVRLYFDAAVKDLNAAFKDVAFTGTLNEFKNSDYYKTEVINRFLPQIFKGRLAKIPLATQLKIFEAMKYDADSISGEEFKDKFYLVLRAQDDTIYNTQLFNQTQVTAITVQKLINFGSLKTPDEIGTPEIDGVKLEMKALFKDIKESIPNAETVHAYFLLENLKHYKNSSTTSQQLVDKSIVLVNGNPEKISILKF